MAVQLATSFTAWQMTDEELKAGKTLSLCQIQFLQTQQAEIAQQRLNLDLDIQNPVKFAQDEALLKGQLQMIAFLLASHEEANPTVVSNPS